MTGNAQDRSLPVCCCDLATIDKTGNSTATTTQTIDARNLQATRIAAADDLRPLARTVEIEPAHLEAMADLPDAIEDQPMTLIGFRQRPFASKILDHREWDLGEAAERCRILIPQTTQRIRER